MVSMFPPRGCLVLLASLILSGPFHK